MNNNSNLKNTKADYIFGGVFFFGGLIFFIVAVSLTFSGMIKKNSLDSTVEAISIDEKCRNDSCSPVYHYIVNGNNYTCTINSLVKLRVDKNQKLVYYDSSNPSDCVTDYTVKPKPAMYFSCLFPLIFVYIGFNHMKKGHKNVKEI